MKTREIHTQLSKIQEKLDTLRVVVWNKMAEEERYPKPKVKAWVVLEFGERFLGVHSTKEKADAARIEEGGDQYVSVREVELG